MSKVFKQRLVAPSATDKNWLHVSKGGYNSCILISGNSVLPNCVGYAWGRWRELLGETPKLSRGNAENWYGYIQDGYKRGKTPKLGAVICFSKGKVGVASDGAGHVAIVEEIYSDGSILICQSNYGGVRFNSKRLYPPFNWNSLKFQGFIYPPVDFIAGKEYLNLYDTSGDRTVYDSKLKAVGKIKPKKNKGLSYQILCYVNNNRYVEINTTTFGRVRICVDKKTVGDCFNISTSKKY